MTQYKFVVVDYASESAPQDFVRSLKEIGFACLVNHPISKQSVDVIFSEWLNFFNQDRKFSFAYHADRFDGYFSTAISETAKGATFKDLKEYFHYYPWGQVPEDLKSNLEAYYKDAQTLASELLGWVEQQMPREIAQYLSQSLSSMIQDSEQTLLRVLHYPKLTEDKNRPAEALRAAAHTDINLLTILPAANSPGLQVLSADGDWIDVPCDFGMLIVNAGDMLNEACGGYFPSTVHRVINPDLNALDNVSRVSMPLFLHPRPEVVLSPSYTAGEYLSERLKELGF